MEERKKTGNADTKRYRIIFDGLTSKANSKRIVLFFQKELGLSENVIRKLLTTPPRIFWEVASQSDAEMIQKALKQMGCIVYYESVVVYPSCPFAVSRKHHRFIKKELSKILRGRTNLAMFLVQVEPQDPQNILASVMGTFEDELANSFRESDTVFGIDDNRIIVLGFSTDKAGVRNVKNKVRRVIKGIMGEDAKVSIGFSLFPEEGRNFQELLYFAEQKRNKEENRCECDPEADTQLYIPPSRSWENDSESTPLQLCFLEARGKVFKRLLEMEPETLWIGLSHLPRSKQKEFLARLPFDSNVLPALREMTETNQPEPDKPAEDHFTAVMSLMDIENGIRERNKFRREIELKLSRVEELPTLPTIAAEVFRIVSDPDASVEELAAVIMNDPSLTSKLLKTVNSAYFGNLQKIGTVRQAIVFLGTEEIMDLAFGLAAAKVFDIKEIKKGISPKLLWRHSICTALIAQNLCRGFPEYKKSGAMTAGLLHDFGKIFLMENYYDLYEEIHTEHVRIGIPLCEMEEELFGLNHGDIGKTLATSWNLPDSLVEAITYHHQPLSAEKHCDLAAIIGLSDYLYHEASKQDESQTFPVRLTHGHWEMLGQIFKDLDIGHLESMVEDAENIIKVSHDLLAIIDKNSGD